MFYLDQFEVFQCIIDTVFIDIVRDVVGIFLNAVKAVSHGDPDRTFFQHLHIVLTVADGQCLTWIDVPYPEGFVDPDGFGDPFGNDIPFALPPWRKQGVLVYS